ncbi:MAG: hypothetical protein ABIG30_00770 [Candidatus Aenigmatarchaeota archaeon]
MPFIMRDENLWQDFGGPELNDFAIKTLGHSNIVCPYELKTTINPTTPPGGCSSIWYSLMFWFSKQEWLTAKVDEWMEVSPVHAQYYQLTKSQKEAVESKIKEGLRSVQQSVADYELLLHDQRRYQEFKDYIDNKDEHSLKTIFVDQVDFYSGFAGEGAGRLSMSFMQQRNIMPTIVQDFYDMESEDDLEKKERFKDLPSVEKNMLRTKWRAYKEWRDKLFAKEVAERYRRISELVRSREKSIKEYREWLKPYIVRHRLLQESLGDTGRRKRALSDWYHSTGHATSQDMVTIWAWKATLPYELQKTPGELIAQEAVDVFNQWTKKNLIFNKKHGLISDYPWITDEWVESQRKSIEKMAKPDKWYYAFVIIETNRTNLRLQNGSEIEDAVFKMKGFHFSNNALAMKLLEKAAKEEEMERYVNELLGMPLSGKEETPEQTKKHEKMMKKFETKENMFDKISGSLSNVGLDFQFLKSRGPYERDFDDRIVKWYLRRLASARYIPIVKFLKERCGYGGKMTAQ